MNGTGDRDNVRGDDFESRSAEAIVTFDASGRRLSVSAAASRAFGWDPKAMGEGQILDLVHPDDTVRMARVVQDMARPGNHSSVETFRVRAGDGGWRWAEALLTALYDVPEVGCLVVALRDVTDRITAENDLVWRSRHDPLTGLLNRDGVRSVLDSCLQEDRTVFFVGLDRFRYINDYHGALAGDDVLGCVGRRLESLAELGATTGRIGGDEFAVMVRSIVPLEIADIAATLTKTLAEPIGLRNGDEVTVSASVGVVTCEPQQSGVDVFAAGDLALSTAKREQRGQIVFLDEELTQRTREHLAHSNALTEALTSGTVRVEFQPLIDLRSGVAVGAEALLRILSPGGGSWDAAKIVRAAEETGLGQLLDAVVLGDALDTVVCWDRELGDRPPLYVSVNVTPASLHDRHYAENTLAAIASRGLTPDRLCIEVPEKTLLITESQAVASLHRLRQAGVGVSLDDFGTHYSSLTWLRTFPITEVKIDRSFVADVASDPSATAIVTAICGLAEEFGLSVVAEGVEEGSVSAALTDVGNLVGQGWLWSKALPLDDFIAFVSAQSATD